jgi:uncharacterized protein
VRNPIKALSLLSALWFSTVPALADVPVPAYTAHVIDQTGTLQPDERASLEQKLADFEKTKGSQIAVLIVPTTEPETVEQYALRVAEQWKLGRKKIDDGALLVVAKNDRALRIEVGYGLEGALTDVTCARIIREVIVPLFKSGSFYAGIDAGVDRMIKVVEGEPLPQPDDRPYQNESSWQSMLPIVLVISIIIGPLLRALFGRVFGSVATGGIAGFLVWLMSTILGVAIGAGVLSFLFTLLFSSSGMGGGTGWSSRGRYSNINWGGGGWSGGGGFGGGGGGSFGGGGASGSW